MLGLKSAMGFIRACLQTNIPMIQKIFKKRILAGIGGLVLFLNHLAQVYYLEAKISNLLVIAIFIGLLYFSAVQKQQLGKVYFTKSMADNLQLSTAAFFSFLIFLLLYQLMMNFTSPSPMAIVNRLSDFLPVMVQQAYKKAIIFIPLSFVFGFIFSMGQDEKKGSEDILDDFE